MTHVADASPTRLRRFDGQLGYADGLIRDLRASCETHREYVQSVIGTRDGLESSLRDESPALAGRTVFIGDT